MKTKNFPRNQCVLTCICGVMVCDHVQWSLFSWAQCPVNRHALPIVRPKWSVCFDKDDDTTADKYIGRKKLKKKVLRCKDTKIQELGGFLILCYQGSPIGSNNLLCLMSTSANEHMGCREYKYLLLELNDLCGKNLIESLVILDR